MGLRRTSEVAGYEDTQRSRITSEVEMNISWCSTPRRKSLPAERHPYLLLDINTVSSSNSAGEYSVLAL